MTYEQETLLKIYKKPKDDAVLCYSIFKLSKHGVPDPQEYVYLRTSHFRSDKCEYDTVEYIHKDDYDWYKELDLNERK